MFIAHLDEVGFEVTNIASGRNSLATTAWRTLSVTLGRDSRTPSFRQLSPSAAVEYFVPRESATRKQPEALTAWFGFTAEELKKDGVRVGLSVTAEKRANRLGATRFTARALDDRAGSTALGARRAKDRTFER